MTHLDEILCLHGPRCVCNSVEARIMTTIAAGRPVAKPAREGIRRFSLKLAAALHRVAAFFGGAR